MFSNHFAVFQSQVHSDSALHELPVCHSAPDEDHPGRMQQPLTLNTAFGQILVSRRSRVSPWVVVLR